MAISQFLFVVYGGAPVYTAQTHGAVLSMLAHLPPGGRVVVLTDTPAEYRWLSAEVEVREFDAAALSLWREPTGYPWRFKMAALRDHLYPGAANALVDTDTITRRDLGSLVAALDGGELLLDRRETSLAASRRRGDRRFWARVGAGVWGGMSAADHPDLWNAGVIGVGPGGVEHLDQALAVCDELARASDNDFQCEQYALSLTFGSTGKLAPASAWIDHYWDNKGPYDRALSLNLSTVLARGLSVRKTVEMLREDPVLLPLRRPKRPPGWKRWVLRRLGETVR